MQPPTKAGTRQGREGYQGGKTKDDTRDHSETGSGNMEDCVDVQGGTSDTKRTGKTRGTMRGSYGTGSKDTVRDDDRDGDSKKKGKTNRTIRDPYETDSDDMDQDENEDDDRREGTTMSNSRKKDRKGKTDNNDFGEVDVNSENNDDLDDIESSGQDDESDDDEDPSAVPRDWKRGQAPADPKRDAANKKRRDKRKKAELDGTAEAQRDIRRKERIEKLEILIQEARDIVLARKKAVQELPKEVLRNLKKDVTMETQYPNVMSQLVPLLAAFDKANNMTALPSDSPALALLAASPQTQDLVLRLCSNVLIFNPNGHPALVAAGDESLGLQSITAMTRGEESMDLEDEDTVEDAASDMDGDVFESLDEITDTVAGATPNMTDSQAETDDIDPTETDESASAEQSKQVGPQVMKHYMRTCRLKLGEAVKVFTQELIAHPADVVHLTTLLEELESMRDKEGFGDDQMITIGYLGASVVGEGSDRLAQDHQKTQQSHSKLLHWMSALKEHVWIAYQIPALDIELDTNSTDHASPLDPDQAWLKNSNVWSIEQMLITAASRELTGNSAYGGSSNTRFSLSDVEQDIFDRVKSVCRIGPLSSSFAIDKEMHDWLLQENQHQRQILKEMGGQKPIRNSAVKKAAQQSAAIPRIHTDGTINSLTIGKDIPLRDGMNRASWGGDVKGPAAYLYSSIRNAVCGGDREIILSLSDGLAQIAHLYGPFLDYWSLCLIHLLILLCLLFLIRRLCRIRPRVLFVISDKVTALFLSRQTVLWEHAAFESLQDNKPIDIATFRNLWRNLKGKRKDPRWWGIALGDFIRLRVGEAVIVEYGFQQEPLWAVMVIGLHFGYYQYRPALQWRLYRLFFLVNILHRLAEVEAESWVPITGAWSKADAEALQLKVMNKADEIGLTTAIKNLREELAELISNLTSLSGLAPQDLATRTARQAQQAESGLTSTHDRMFNAVVAQGSADSHERHQQLQWFQTQTQRVPSPKDVIPLSSAWDTWFLALRQGIVVAQAVNRSYLSLESAQANASRARAVVDRVRQSRLGPSVGTFLAYTSKYTLSEVVLLLIDAENVKADRMKASFDLRLVSCSACGRAGVVDTSMARHWCQAGGDGVVINSDQPNLEVSKLLFPLQLLIHPFFTNQVLEIMANHPQVRPITSTITLDGQQHTRFVGAIFAHQANTARGQKYAKYQQTVGDRFAYRSTHDLELRLGAGVVGVEELTSTYRQLCSELATLETNGEGSGGLA